MPHPEYEPKFYWSFLPFYLYFLLTAATVAMVWQAVEAREVTWWEATVAGIWVMMTVANGVWFWFHPVTPAQREETPSPDPDFPNTETVG